MNVENFILVILFLYMPFHFLEEALGEFPKWMHQHWTPVQISYGNWMANNIFIFYPFLVITYLLYHFSPGNMTSVGAGLLIWGIINGIEHIFYSIKDQKIAPGIVTGLLLLLDAAIGFYCLFTGGQYHLVDLIISVITGGLLFGLPCFLSKKLGKVMAQKFGEAVKK